MDTVAKRAELEAALPGIVKLINGLHDWEAVSISDGLRAKVQASITEHERRRTLINAELKELNDLDSADNALVADGYPDLPDILLTQAEFDELNEQQSDFDAATEVFSLEQATSAAITFGPPIPKV